MLDLFVNLAELFGDLPGQILIVPETRAVDLQLKLGG